MPAIFDIILFRQKRRNRYRSNKRNVVFYGLKYSSTNGEGLPLYSENLAEWRNTDVGVETMEIFWTSF